MSSPRLIAITDSERSSFEAWLAQLERLLARAAPNSVQVMLRDRQLPVRQRHALGARLRELTRRHAQALCVNDRLDLAALLEADAVHLSASSVSVADARAFASLLGRRWWVSRACHDPSEALLAEADALLLSPIAEARKGRPALGVEGVRQARAGLARRLPEAGMCQLYALGGITAANAADYLAAGAHGVALIGALLEAGAPDALIDALGVRR